MNSITNIVTIQRDPDLFDGLIDTVNARHLHKALGSKKAFSDWVKNRIKACGFKENEDFVSYHQTVKREVGASTCIEYFLTLDAAKHFAMLEKTETGFAIRQYFVEYEKQAKKVLPAPLADQISQAVADALGPRLSKLEAAMEVMSPKALVFDKIASSYKDSVCEFARKLEGVNMKQVQSDLVELGILYRHGTGYRVASRYRGSHFTEKVSSENPAYMIIRVEPKGMELLARLHEQGKLTLTKSYVKAVKKAA